MASVSESRDVDEFPMLFVTDFRLRGPGVVPILVGDSMPMQDGSEGIVYAKRWEGGREHLVVVPVEMVSEEWMARMYRGEFQSEEDLPRGLGAAVYATCVA